MKPEESVTRAESGLVFMYRVQATGFVCTGLSGHADLKSSPSSGITETSQPRCICSR